MNKKFISVIMAAILTVSVAAVSAGAAEVETEKSGGATGTFKFDMGNWDHDHSSQISFYIWAKNADGTDTKYGSTNGWVDSNNWGSKKTYGTPVEGEDGIVESYEIEFLDGYDTFCIVYDPQSGIQTFDSILTENAIGDTCRCLDEMIENPEDSAKQAFVLGFDNAGDCGPKLVITSTGNIVGNVKASNENGAATVANYVYKSIDDEGTKSANDKSGAEKINEQKLADAVNAFGTSADDVWAQYESFKGREGYELYDAKEAFAKKLINPTSAQNESSSEAGTSSTNSTTSTTSTTSKSSTSTTSKSSTSTTSKSTTTGGTTASTAAATDGGATETGDARGVAAFATVLVGAAAAVFATRKKIED